MQREFHLLAFSSYGQLKLLIFVGVLCVYLLVVFGNTMITALVYLVPQLQTPMYFFLCNLAVQDIMYVSSLLPKLLVITITGNTSISFTGCISQMFLFVFCVGTEFFLLSVMAYDRYVAICIPLNYSLIMSKCVCLLLVTSCWIIGTFNALLYSSLISKLSFCNVQEVNHFFCDMKTLLKLTCSDITHIRILLALGCLLLGFLSFALTLTSYVYIISSILKIHTTGGRLKTFSSCSSHLTILILFYGTSLSLYVKPETEESQEQEKFISILNVAVIPMLNPVVYSFRNKQVLNAIKKQKIRQAIIEHTHHLLLISYSEVESQGSNTALFTKYYDSMIMDRS
ncbi:olfactory receptor 5J3-like [Discoglossus pictus]